jgi:hypothetical protein
MDQYDIDLSRYDLQCGLHGRLSRVSARYDIMQFADTDATQLDSERIYSISGRRNDDVMHSGMPLIYEERLDQYRLPTQHTELFAVTAQAGTLARCWNDDGYLSVG